MKQPWAWVGWLVATLVILSITRNPLYLLLVLLCVVIVGISVQQSSPGFTRPFSLWKLATWIILLATIFNALTSHFGTTVMFTIPGKLPLISGRITLEAIVYGATNGLVLTGMLASFAVLNIALPVRDMIGLIPRAFFPLAVVSSIAVTYLPTTMRQFRQIREAQAIRGHQMRTLRDWLPLWMPLLVGGLEHAMQLAEAMTARGFASPSMPSKGATLYPRLAMILGLLLLAGGWILQLGDSETAGLILLLVGAAFVLGGLWSVGRKSHRTSYHRQDWTWKDGLGLGIALAVLLLCTLSVPMLGKETLFYDPYPSITLPAFNPFLGAVLLGLVAPSLMTGRLRDQETTGNEAVHPAGS